MATYEDFEFEQVDPQVVNDLQTQLDWAWKDQRDLESEKNDLEKTYRALEVQLERVQRDFSSLVEGVRQARVLSRWDGNERVAAALTQLLEEAGES